MVETMVIYSPINPPSTAYIGRIRHMLRLHTLEFVDWGHGYREDGPNNIGVGVMVVCREISSRTPPLRSLKFVDSVVDSMALMMLSREHMMYHDKKLGEVVLLLFAKSLATARFSTTKQACDRDSSTTRPCTGKL
jgi:hypothetical protein